MVRAFCLMIFSNSRIYASGGVAVSGEAVSRCRGGQCGGVVTWRRAEGGVGARGGRRRRAVWRWAVWRRAVWRGRELPG